VPPWAWINLLAHGSEDALRRAARTRACRCFETSHHRPPVPASAESSRGAVLIVVGIGVFTRNQLSRWVFVYPIPVLIHFLAASAVIYGLSTYGDPKEG